MSIPEAISSSSTLSPPWEEWWDELDLDALRSPHILRHLSGDFWEQVYLISTPEQRKLLIPNAITLSDRSISVLTPTSDESA